MICLGIESTAHTFGIGIVNEEGKILANEKNMFVPEEGGILPREAAEHHVNVCDEILNKALERTNLKIGDIDLIAFSQGPGLPPCLKIGAVFARILSLRHNIPLIGVNHCIAHLEIGKLFSGFKNPVLLYVSGANTQVIAFEGGKYRLFGETHDMGVGNFIDTFGRKKGLQFPAGPKIEELAKKTKKYSELPYTVKGMDLNFSGILTTLLKKDEKMEVLCYSLQETVFAMLVEIAERAMAHTQKNELVLGGGVACNERLNEMCEIMCGERGAKFARIPKSVAVDNGAMIAWTGLIMNKAGLKTEIKDSKINKSYRTDQVNVIWN